jgi:hypothetical protein
VIADATATDISAKSGVFADVLEKSVSVAEITDMLFIFDTVIDFPVKSGAFADILAKSDVSEDAITKSDVSENVIAKSGVSEEVIAKSGVFDVSEEVIAKSDVSEDVIAKSDVSEDAIAKSDVSVSPTDVPVESSELAEITAKFDAFTENVNSDVIITAVNMKKFFFICGFSLVYLRFLRTIL